MKSKSPSLAPDPVRKKPRLSMIVILLVAWIVTVMPFFFWKATWFGGKLTNDEIAGCLSDNHHPRDTQHALVQISDRLSQGDATVKRFYPHVVALADSPIVELRMTAAWVMGQDNSDNSFHQTLLRLLGDTEPLVRWNAALGLVRFNDSSGRSALHEMLRPFTVTAPASGLFKERLKIGDSVNRGTLMAQITPTGNKAPVEVRSPVPGRIKTQLIKNGETVSSGTPVLILAPDEKQVWETLRAFYLIGASSDLPDVRAFLSPRDDMPPRIRDQAQLTVEAIENRK